MRQQFDNFSSNYEDILASSTGNLSKDGRFQQAKLDALLQHIPQIQHVHSVLDFGCGIGGLIGFLANRFAEADITGYDPSIQSLEVARKAYAGNVRIRFHDVISSVETYDLILASNVFHHIPPKDRAATLDVLRQRLSSRGRLVVFEHNPLNPLTRLVVSRCPFDADAVLISQKDFSHLAKVCGFAVEAAAYFLLLPYQACWLRRIEYLMRSVPLGAQYFVSLTHGENSAS